MGRFEFEVIYFTNLPPLSPLKSLNGMNVLDHFKMIGPMLIGKLSPGDKFLISTVGCHLSSYLVDRNYLCC